MLAKNARFATAILAILRGWFKPPRLFRTPEEQSLASTCLPVGLASVFGCPLLPLEHTG